MQDLNKGKNLRLQRDSNHAVEPHIFFRELSLQLLIKKPKLRPLYYSVILTDDVRIHLLSIR